MNEVTMKFFSAFFVYFIIYFCTYKYVEYAIQELHVAAIKKWVVNFVPKSFLSRHLAKKHGFFKVRLKPSFERNMTNHPRATSARCLMNITAITITIIMQNFFNGYCYSRVHPYPFTSSYSL